MKTRTFAALLLIAVSFTACRTPEGESVGEQRASVLAMRDETLARLYQERPEAEKKLQEAEGYGAFSTLGLKLMLASSNGFGVVRDNETGQDTYMKMRELGVGVGLGVKDTRIVIVFHSRDAMTDFTEKGWQWGGDADAAAQSGDTGTAATAGAEVKGGMEAYVLTEAGIALQATVTGTKYWKDEDLNVL
jgi:lipid-binding SYLF domain-containing protein